MSAAAENTAQTHAMGVREYLQRHLPKLRGDVTKGVPKRHPENGPLPTKKDAWLTNDHGGEWRYTIVGGLLAFEFIRPITWGQTREAFRAYGSKEMSHKYADSRAIVGKCAVLTRTSKMGCYSWNMPAGPMSKGGTCPGSTLAYRLWKKKPDKKGAGGEVLVEADEDQVAKAIREMRAHNKQLREAVPGSVAEARQRFICNGCYALKGAYGNPSVITVMEWRKQWRDWALRTGEFADVMVEAIRLARERSKDIKPQTPEEISVMTHPNYFRIHDSGDMDSEEYLLAWFDVCRKLPYVNFWAPTRVWADAGEPGRDAMMDVLKKYAKHLPPNLAMRPSGLFFDGGYPVISYLSAGATSTLIEVHPARGGLKVSIPAVADDAWGCPAYMPTVIGGGALPSKKGKKKAEDTLASEETLGEDDRLENPVRQTYSMFPKLDDAARLNPEAVFYAALVDADGNWVIDPHTGQPVKATKKNMLIYGTTKTEMSQAFQTSGCCTLARDHKGARECRVCWNVSSDKRDRQAKSLPIVYGKH